MMRWVTPAANPAYILNDTIKDNVRHSLTYIMVAEDTESTSRDRQEAGQQEWIRTEITLLDKPAVEPCRSTNN